jgi:transcription initiation factor IIE alpha subunit
VQSSTRTWKIQPLNMVIVEILEKKGSLTDVELLEALKSIYKDLSINELNKTLMRMEITGLISVSSLTKGRRLVQLTKK